jgi:hypothetical protein
MLYELLEMKGEKDLIRPDLKISLFAVGLSILRRGG